MKKRYISPEMDIIEFDTKDVITTSGGEPVLGGSAPELSDVVNINEDTGWSGWIN